MVCYVLRSEHPLPSNFCQYLATTISQQDIEPVVISTNNNHSLKSR